MQFYITIAQVIVSILLIGFIILQKQGTDLGGIFGGTQENYYSRRGAEKGFFYAAIACSVIFLGLGLVSLFL